MGLLKFELEILIKYNRAYVSLIFSNSLLVKRNKNL